MNILDYLHSDKILFFDGGTGSVLQSRGLQPGELPETWNIQRPEEIIRLHSSYYQAGCNIVKTNTFGANRLKFDADELALIVSAALTNADTARQMVEKDSSCEYQYGPHYIALDIGPTGKLLKPLGDLEFEDAVSLFKETIALGVKTKKADLILIETMNDSYETKAAVLAAKEVCDLPIFVTTVYDESGKLLTGADAQTCVSLLEGLGVSAIGMNCSLGPKQMIHLVPDLIKHASVPVIVNPNAGLPRSENGKTVYDVSEEEFTDLVSQIVDMGAKIVGGCCGTTPDYIARLVKACKDKSNTYPIPKNEATICSYTHAVSFDKRPVLIGERINPTGKKRFQQALRDHDIDYILQEGLRQQENGAVVLDVNVGLPGIDEAQMICDVVFELQSILDLPLQLDTSDPHAMERAMRMYNGKPLINSVNGKEESMRAIFPLVKKYGGMVVALLLDENGIPKTSEERLKIAEKIYRVAEEYHIPRHDILIDSLAMTVANDDQAAWETLKTVRSIKEIYNGKTILGVSNISFGLPHREIVTSAFFSMAMQAGLSAAIINPNLIEIKRAYACYCMLAGLDPQCLDYLAFAEKYDAELSAAKSSASPTSSQTAIDTVSTSASSGRTDKEEALFQSIVRGLGEQSSTITQELLQADVDPMAMIDRCFIAALNYVGKRFEEKKLYLPQLLMSANATSQAFEVIKTHFAKSGIQRQKKCPVILATVKGDIHDIGKNIVKVLLENYGFDVIDLGKDVPPEVIVDCCVERKVPMVGLSALMTTTVPSMEETIRLLRVKAPWVKVVVGGAVLTQEYADQIGADCYCKEAMDTVNYGLKIDEEYSH